MGRPAFNLPWLGHNLLADMAEAEAYERARELDLPRRHRSEVDDEIAKERRAITYIEQKILASHGCDFCPVAASFQCVACDQWVCDDDGIDGACPDCVGAS